MDFDKKAGEKKTEGRKIQEKEMESKIVEDKKIKDGKIRDEKSEDEKIIDEKIIDGKIIDEESEDEKNKDGKLKDAKIDYGSMEYRQAEMIKERMAAYGEKEQGGYTLADYYALPDERRVELIDGVFYDMAAPTLAHQLAGSRISRCLEEYIEVEKGDCITMVAPVDVQLDCDEDTMVQPDVMVVCDRNRLLNRCVYGAPDFIVEVLSPATGRKDSLIKLAKYRAAGVREYWMVDLDRKKVVVYEFGKEESPVIYGMEQEVPVGIFDGRCRVDFTKVYEKVRFLMEPCSSIQP